LWIFARTILVQAQKLIFKFFSNNFQILSIKDYVFEGRCPFPLLGFHPRPHSGLRATGASGTARKSFFLFLSSPKPAEVKKKKKEKKRKKKNLEIKIKGGGGGRPTKI